MCEKVWHDLKPGRQDIIRRFAAAFRDNNHIADAQGMPGKVSRMVNIEFFIQGIQLLLNGIAFNVPQVAGIHKVIILMCQVCIPVRTECFKAVKMMLLTGF